MRNLVAASTGTRPRMNAGTALALTVGVLMLPAASHAQPVPQPPASDPLAAYGAARDAVLAAPHRSRLDVSTTTRVGGATGRQTYTATTAAASATRFTSGGFARARLAGDAVRIVGVGSRYYAVAKDGRAYFGPPRPLLRLALSPGGDLRLPEPVDIGALRAAPSAEEGTARFVGPLTPAAGRELVNILIAEDPTSPLGARSRISGANAEVTFDAATGRLVGTRVSLDVVVPAGELKGLPSVWVTGKPTDLRYTLRAVTHVSMADGPITVVVPPKAVSAHALLHDANAQALLRRAARAFEAHYLGVKTFSGLTPTRLRALEPTIVFQAAGNGMEATRRVGFREVNGGYGYELRAVSRSGRLFVYRRDALGQVFTSCRTPAGRPCGTW